VLTDRPTPRESLKKCLFEFARSVLMHG